VCSSLSKPVNFMVGIPGRSFSVAELQDAGVRRISLATSLHRAAMSGLYRAAMEIKEHGSFEFLNGLVSPKELGRFLR
jgi:2-methylisocitrate lyase-like PEP mutase family enzyme